MLSRRHFIQTTTALFSAAISTPLLAASWPTERQKAAWDVQVTNQNGDTVAMFRGKSATIQGHVIPESA